MKSLDSQGWKVTVKMCKVLPPSPTVPCEPRASPLWGVGAKAGAYVGEMLLSESGSNRELGLGIGLSKGSEALEMMEVCFMLVE